LKRKIILDKEISQINKVSLQTQKKLQTRVSALPNKSQENYLEINNIQQARITDKYRTNDIKHTNIADKYNTDK
jgi:hypothetical protein